MKAYLYAAALLLAVSRGDAADDKPSDHKLILGTWEVVSSSQKGEDGPGAPGMRYVFKPDTFLMQPASAKTEEDAIRVKYKLDPAKKPKHIDTTHQLGEKEKPIVQLGIYSLEGETLKLCLEAAGKPRPAKLESKPDGTSVLLVLKRQKEQPMVPKESQ